MKQFQFRRFVRPQYSVAMSLGTLSLGIACGARTPAIAAAAPAGVSAPKNVGVGAPKSVAKATPADPKPNRPAATPVAVQPVFAPVKLFLSSTLSEETLPNGVRGVVKATQGTNVVSVQVWVRAGSRFENSNNNGVAHMIETLALRSSKNYPRPPLGGAGGGASDAITALGGVLSSQTSRDATFYSATVAAQFLPAALRILSDAVLQPSLDPSSVEATKQDVETDLQRRGGDPEGVVSDLLYQTAFGAHPYKRPANGTVDSIEALNSDIVRSYYRARYSGPNISVVIVGDVGPSSAHKLIAAYFASAPRAKGAEPVIAPEEGPSSYHMIPRHALVRGTTMAIGFRAPGIKTPADVVATDVLLSYWREGRHAALRPLLLGKQAPDDSNPIDPSAPPAAPNVEQSDALAVAYDVDFLTQRDPSLFTITVLMPSDKHDAVLDVLQTEIAKIQKHGIDADGLRQAKLELARQYVEQDETVSGQGGALGFYDMIDSYRFGADYLDIVSKVTSDDVKRIANKYLSSTVYVMAIISPAPVPQAPTRPPEENPNTITAEAPSDLRLANNDLTIGRRLLH